MADNTKIEWATLGLSRGATFNPLRAFRKDNGKRGWHCVRKNAACKNCYAATRNRNTFYGNGLDYTVANLSEVELRLVDVEKPLTWKASRGIFWCSMTDVFGEFVPNDFTAQMISVAVRAERHRHAFLTKRPERMLEFFQTSTWRGDFPNHVWLGASIHDQACAEEFMPHLLELREILGEQAVIWISAEPLLGPIDLSKWIGEFYCSGCGYRGPDTSGENDEDGNSVCPVCGRGHDSFTMAETHGGLEDWQRQPISWVVAGGESGSKARPMHPNWVRSLRDQCQSAGLPFFFKQWGEYMYRENGIDVTHWRIGKKLACRKLDEMEWSEFPL